MVEITVKRKTGKTHKEIQCIQKARQGHKFGSGPKTIKVDGCTFAQMQFYEDRPGDEKYFKLFRQVKEGGCKKTNPNKTVLHTLPEEIPKSYQILWERGREIMFEDPKKPKNHSQICVRLNQEFDFVPYRKTKNIDFQCDNLSDYEEFFDLLVVLNGINDEWRLPAFVPSGQ